MKSKMTGKRNKLKAQTNKGVSSTIKFLFLASILIFSLSFISATNVVSYKQASPTTFRISTNQSSCNITISQIGGNIIVNNKAMSISNGMAYYDLNSTQTKDIGTYQYFSNNCGSGTFDITPSGYNDTNNIVFVIVALILCYTLNLVGFFKRNSTITILGGFALVAMGLYMVTNGIIIFRNNLTLTLSYITLFWGAGSALWAAIETIQDNM